MLSNSHKPPQAVSSNCDCAICKNRKDFQFSSDLLRDLYARKLTVFAGAGISTESRDVLKFTLYDAIAGELGLSDKKLLFSQLMHEYEKRPNGRIKLLAQISDRLAHIDSFPELSQSASRFHKELGTLHHVKNIITTNWDTYFERHCQATPFVEDTDLAFWEAAERRVLKIHGSISNLGSIVATTGDYAKCQRRLQTGLIGSLLKSILATQTIVFIGYSLTDPDFKVVFDFVRKQMKALHRQSYVVTPDASAAESFRKIGLIPIITDGAYFISRMKEHAVNDKQMLPDALFSAADELLDRVIGEHHELHRRVKLSKHPEIIYAASYQDGMIHGLARALNMRGSGRYSDERRLQLSIGSYFEMQKEKKRSRQYADVAYIEGYLNALLFLVFSDDQRKHIPLYFAYGAKSDLRTLNNFLSFVRKNPNAHKASFKDAVKFISTLENPEGMEFHHPPWL